MKTIIIPCLLAFAIIVTSCKKGTDEKLSHEYTGILTYEYSRDFPDFDCIVSMALVVAKDGTVTFGSKEANSFDGEDIYYDNNSGAPSLKMKVTGAIELTSAQGQYQKIDNQDYVLIWVNANTTGTRYIWNWDQGTQNWVAPSTDAVTAINYTDTYAKGQLQFSIKEACADSAKFKTTVPDVHGNYTLGYELHLIESTN